MKLRYLAGPSEAILRPADLNGTWTNYGAETPTRLILPPVASAEGFQLTFIGGAKQEVAIDTITPGLIRVDPRQFPEVDGTEKLIRIPADHCIGTKLELINLARQCWLLVTNRHQLTFGL